VCRRTGDGRWSPRQQREGLQRGEHTRLHQFGPRQRQRRFEPEHPGGRLFERLLLRLDRVRRVVGGDGVDRAVGQPRFDCSDVGTSA
jgi:hypothetical protein